MNSKSLKMGGLVLGASMVLAVGVSYLTTTSQAVEIWRKVAQEIQAVPLSLGLEVQGVVTVGTSNRGTSTVGGFTEVRATQDMRSGTTTKCAIVSPNATSTLSKPTAIFTTAPTAGGRLSIYKGSTAYSTTTLLSTSLVTAGASTTHMGTSTTDDMFFPPNYFAIFDYEGGNVGSVGTGAGECGAEFNSLSL